MNRYIAMNDTLKVFYPEGFHVMDESERSRLTAIAEGPMECLSDPERHSMITIGYKQIGALTGMLLSAKDAAKSAESYVRKALKANNYRTIGFLTKKAGGETAEGYSFEYEAEGIPMCGETYVVKRGKAFYYLHFYTRTAYKDENLEIWNGMLASMVWE